MNCVGWFCECGLGLSVLLGHGGFTKGFGIRKREKLMLEEENLGGSQRGIPPTILRNAQLFCRCN